MFVIIDYGMGNVRSIYNAFTLLGKEVIITDDPKIIAESEAIILPGVGAFSDGMNNLKKKGLIDVLKNEVITKKKPYLGICLGLEFLATQSNEGGIFPGLGWINHSGQVGRTLCKPVLSSSANNAFALTRSAVSKPSVNQA